MGLLDFLFGGGDSSSDGGRDWDRSVFDKDINVGGYIGESTRNEIAYAKSQGIAVRYLE